MLIQLRSLYVNPEKGSSVASCKRCTTEASAGPQSGLKHRTYQDEIEECSDKDKQGNVNYIAHESTLYVQFIRTNAMCLDLPHIR